MTSDRNVLLPHVIDLRLAASWEESPLKSWSFTILRVWPMSLWAKMTSHHIFRFSHPAYVEVEGEVRTVASFPRLVRVSFQNKAICDYDWIGQHTGQHWLSKWLFLTWPSLTPCGDRYNLYLLFHLYADDAWSASLPCKFEKRSEGPASLGGPCDNSYFSARSHVMYTRLFMFGNKHSKEFQHFVFLYNYYFQFSFMITQVICACSWRVKHSTYFNMKVSAPIAPPNPDNVIPHGPEAKSLNSETDCWWLHVFSNMLIATLWLLSLQHCLLTLPHGRSRT